MSARLSKDVHKKFRNYYECSECGARWEDEGGSKCKDHCPDCRAEIEPFKSEEVFSSRPDPDHMMVAETLNKKHAGDPISDAELNATVDTLEPLVDFIHCLGPHYHLFWKDLLQDLNDLKDFQRHRNIRT